MTTATDDASRALAKAAALGFAVLGWLGAQWLTFGILKHAHVFTGELAGHHHHGYAAPLAVAVAAATTTVLLLVLRVRLGAPPAGGVGDLPHPRGAGLWMLVAVLLFVVVELTEFALSAHHDVMPLIAVLGLGAALQSALALLARTAWSLTHRFVTRSTPLPGTTPFLQPAAPVLVLRDPIALISRWTGRLAPSRGPPYQTAP